MNRPEESGGRVAGARQTARGSAEQLHALDLLASAPGVWRLDPVHPAVVLGSGQPDDVVDRAAVAAAGLEWCRRRSGGGLVLVDPADSVWIDVVLARGGASWDDDVHRAARQVGGVWVAGLRSIGLDAQLHVGPMAAAELGRVVCFAGVGAGEVVVAGRKVVGISQRRDRRGARVQCIVYRRWEPDRLLDVLGPAAADLVVPIGERLTHGVSAAPRLDEVLDEVTADLLALATA